jgi:2-keto-4-pentenoate hydratase
LVAEVAGQATVGWKIAATSEAGQKHLQVDGPLAGRLLANRVHRDGTPIPLGNNGMRVAEAEFAFRLGRDLPPRSRPYELDEVLAAIDTLHPAIEIPDSRYINFCIVGSPQLIADNACAHHFVLGEPTSAEWRTLDLKVHVVRLLLNGTIAREGVGSNVLGDPRIAMTWIANELREHDIGLRAGEIVTTGTSVNPLPIELGSELLADFGVIGTVATVLT